MRCKNGFTTYKRGKALPKGYRDVTFNVALVRDDKLGIVGEFQVIFKPMLKNKKENNEFYKIKRRKELWKGVETTRRIQSSLPLRSVNDTKALAKQSVHFSFVHLIQSVTSETKTDAIACGYLYHLIDSFKDISDFTKAIKSFEREAVIFQINERNEIAELTPLQLCVKKCNAAAMTFLMNSFGANVKWEKHGTLVCDMIDGFGDISQLIEVFKAIGHKTMATEINERHEIVGFTPLGFAGQNRDDGVMEFLLDYFCIRNQLGKNKHHFLLFCGK